MPFAGYCSTAFAEEPTNSKPFCSSFCPGAASYLSSSWRTPKVLFLLVAFCSFGMGCEPELGTPCGPPDKVNPLIRQAESTNEVIQDVTLDNCSTALCASVSGSRPFCTQTCEADSQCTDAPNFRCDVVTTFGPLGCSDFESLGNTCLKADGTPSDNLTKYCITDKEVLAARDEEYGREPWEFVAEGEPDAEPDASPADAGTSGEK